jgi:hypothetical protein
VSFDPQALMRQAQQMQQELARAQAELANERIDGTSGGGSVIVTASGTGDIVAVKLDPEVVDPSDVEMLEDLIVAAIHDAARAAQEMQQKKLGGLTQGLGGGLGGLGLPGL